LIWFKKLCGVSIFGQIEVTAKAINTFYIAHFLRIWFSERTFYRCRD